MRCLALRAASRMRLYDPRKRGWYATATSGNGKVMITDAFASTVGATVVGITRCAYDKNGAFIGNASIEVSLDTLTGILESIDLGEGSFLMMVQKDGTILADTSPAKNNFKNVTEIDIPALDALLSSANSSGDIFIGGEEYLTKFVTNSKTGYLIVAFTPKSTVFAAFYRTLSITIICCAIISLVIALITAFVARGVMRPLRVIRANILENTNDIAQGKANLSKRIKVKSHDEIGDVAEGFNAFSETLQNIIASMQQSKKSLTSAGDLLKTGTTETAAAIVEISGHLHTYSDKMHCLVAVKDGKCSEPGGFMRKELIPGYGKKKKPSVYTFTSMHFDNALFGYIVTSNSLKSIEDRTLSKYMIQLNYNIEQYRKNCRLEEINRSLLNITNTDRLTGLNNRFGMEKNAVPLFEEAHKDGKSCAVVFIDMNRMKEINDNYGHLQGDLAITA